MATEKSIDKKIELLEKNIAELIVLQEKLNSSHETLLLILKTYCSSIDESNTTKKYFDEIDKKIMETRAKITLSFEAKAIHKKALSVSKKLLLDFQDACIDNDEFKEYVIEKKDLQSKIKKIYTDIQRYIRSNQDLIDKKLLKSKPVQNEINLEQEETIPVIPKTRNIDDASLSPIENTLLISETSKKVILPYTFAEIEKYIQDNPELNLSVEQVIDKVYTIPLDHYKNSVLSRFSESYKLVRNKERGSIKEALDLAMEMAFNYSVHPAIITACNNVNELDIYLACLEYNELNDFKFFKINFEIAPSISKKRKNDLPAEIS